MNDGDAGRFVGGRSVTCVVLPLMTPIVLSDIVTLLLLYFVTVICSTNFCAASMNAIMSVCVDPRSFGDVVVEFFILLCIDLNNAPIVFGVIRAIDRSSIFIAAFDCDLFPLPSLPFNPESLRSPMPPFSATLAVCWMTKYFGTLRPRSVQMMT